MLLLALPDLHGEIGALPRLAAELGRADMVLLAGDLTSGGSAADAICVVETIRRYTSRILAICGNWDTPAVAAYLTTEGINLEDSPRTLGDWTLLGIGGAIRSIFHTPNEYSEEEFAARLDALPIDTTTCERTILVCHQPPLRTRCDRTLFGQHVGSKAVRSYLERIQPRLCVSGHIHEAVGVDTLGRTTVVNPGPLSKRGYATIELSNGDVQVQCHRLG